MKVGRKIATPAYLWPEQHVALKKLAKRRNRSMQDVLREGVDLVLAQYREVKVVVTQQKERRVVPYYEKKGGKGGGGKR